MTKPLSEYLRSISPTQAKSTLPLSSYLSSLPNSTYGQTYSQANEKSFATRTPLSEYLKPVGQAIGTAISPLTPIKGAIGGVSSLFGLGEPGAGIIGKILPGVEKMTQLVEQKEPNKIQKYYEWWKEEQEKRKWQTPEQIQYLTEHPERKEDILKASFYMSFPYGGETQAIAKGLVSPEEAQMFPSTSFSPFMTGTLADFSKLAPAQQASIMKEQAQAYFKKQGIDINKTTSEALRKKYFDLSKQLHPDKPTGSTEAFKELSNYYQIAKENISNLPKQTKLVNWFKGIFEKQIQQERLVDKWYKTPPKEINQREQISVFKNFINPKTIDKPTLDTSDIAMKTTKAGNELPAIRKSGFFATKDIQTAPIVDKFSITQAPHHMALIQDGYKLGGKFGAVYQKIWKPTKEAFVSSKNDKIGFDKEFKDILKENNISITAKNGKLLSDMLEGKTEITNKYKGVVGDIRNFLDKQRNLANEVREKLGKPLIGYIEDYVPHIQKSILWNELLNNKATISDNLDFIVPNEAKNPFAMRRLMEEMPRAERNLFTLIDRYNNAVAKDINITPAIENIKAYNGVIKDRGFYSASRYWDEYIREGLIGKQHKTDTSLDIGQKPRKALQKWNTMVNHAFLTGKVAWNFATQPLSYIMNTPMEAGFINATKAIFKMFNGGVRKFAQENSLSLKIKSNDILASAIGEGRGVVNGIYKTPIDKWNSAISIISAIEEQLLHEASFVAGLDRAKGLGYTGQDAIDFADLVAERTQSMYNKENRALILNSDVTKAVFPFQSFAVEMLNHAKEIAGKDGAMKMTMSQRVGKLLRLLGGLYLANLYSEKLTGRKKTTVGTFVPFLGQFVDALISKVTGEELYSGRSPFTAIQQAEEIIKGAKDYIKYGDLRRLRVVSVNFGLAGLGIGGGGQINNIIDGIMATINEEVKSASGKKLFGVEDLTSKIKAPIFGVWSTEGGRKYWDDREDEGWLEQLFDQGKETRDISDLESKIQKGTATVEDMREAIDLGYIKDDEKSVLKFIEEAKLPDNIREFSHMRTDDQIKFLKGKPKEEILEYLPYANQNFLKKFEEQLTEDKVAKSVDEYDRNVLGLVSDYAKAFMTDPSNAFKALLTKEKLGKVEGNLVELQRFYGIFFTDEGGSQEYKKKLMEEQGISWNDKDKWKLEHIVPVSAGGDNSDSNLMLVNEETHDFFTPIDITVGNAVKDKRITRKEATQLMKDFKINKTITAEEVMEKLK